MQKNDPIEVTWTDIGIVDESDWLTEDEFRDSIAPTCKTMGYFFSEDEKELRLSSTLCTNDNTRADNVIFPKACIITITILHRILYGS